MYAQDNDWQGPTGTGNWFTPANWELGVPTAAQNAVVVNGTTAQVDEQGAVANTLTIGSSSTVQVLSGGLLTLGNPMIIEAGGTFRFSGGNVATSAYQDNGTIVFEGPGDQTLGHNVTGIGRLVLNITGTLTVSSNNTYSGATILTAGTLQAASVTALSPNSAFAVNSILDLNGFNNTVGSLSGTGTVLNNGERTATLTVGNDNTDTAFGGVIENGTSALSLTKIGTGTLALTGINTYSGGTTISAGTLQLGNGGATGSVTGNIIDDGNLAFNRSDSFTFAGVISGTGSVTQIGPGTTILTGTNIYAGGTNLNGGILAVNSDANLGTGPLQL